MVTVQFLAKVNISMPTLSTNQKIFLFFPHSAAPITFFAVALVIIFHSLNHVTESRTL